MFVFFIVKEWEVGKKRLNKANLTAIINRVDHVKEYLVSAILVTKQDKLRSLALCVLRNTQEGKKAGKKQIF